MSDEPISELWFAINGFAAEAEARGIKAETLGYAFLCQGVARLTSSRGRAEAEKALADAIPRLRKGDFDPPPLDRYPIISSAVH